MRDISMDVEEDIPHATPDWVAATHIPRRIVRRSSVNPAAKLSGCMTVMVKCSGYSQILLGGERRSLR